MKATTNIIIIVLILAASFYIYKLNTENRNLKYRNELLNNNLKAYEKDIVGLEDSIISLKITYKLTIAELEKSNESTLKELNKARKDSNIKDKELKELRHFKATAKLDTTIVINKNDSCDFEAVIKYNPQTIFSISSKRIDGVDSLKHSANISASFNSIIYDKAEWKEPNFFKRLFLFRWGKYHYEHNELKSDNELIKIKDFKVIKIVE